MAALPYAVQLYTVREPLSQDLRRTLARVKEAGYDYVELAGLMMMSAEEAKNALDAEGLTAIASHVAWADLKQNMPEAIEAAQIIGYSYIVIPWVGGEMVSNGKSDWIEAATFMDEAGAEIREAGLQLCYHNHAHEFDQLDGEYVFDLLMQRTHPENLAAEIDTYWVQYAGADPAAVIRRYTGRCPLLHVKDMTKDREPAFAELGRGVLDWEAIFEAGRDVGVEWYIVEQDTCLGDPLESIRISAEFMQQQR
jgi:sugar phosphate isomerase/epimerase